MVNKWKVVKQRCSPPSSWFTFLHVGVSQRQHCPVGRMSLGLPTFSACPSISLGINIYRLWGGCPPPPNSLKTKALGVLWGCGSLWGLRMAWTSSLALGGTLENTGHLPFHPPLPGRNQGPERGGPFSKATEIINCKRSQNPRHYSPSPVPFLQEQCQTSGQEKERIESRFQAWYFAESL